MKDKKSRFSFFIKPPIWFCCLVWIFAVLFIAGALTAVALSFMAWISYVLYAFAAVFLAYSVYLLARFAPDVKAALIRQANKHAFTENLIGNYGFRTVVFAVCSFVVSAAYVVFNVVLAALVSSVWYASLAGYYFFLSALRFGILFGGYRLRKKAGENSDVYFVGKLKIYRNCGIALLALEIALAVAVTQMVLSERPAAHTQVMAIAAAAYTFYKVTIALYNLVKVRRYHDPLLQSFRNINLTDAFVSLLALQTTLVAVFSEEASAGMQALNAVTGFSVCALTIFLGVFMIVRAAKQLKRCEEERRRDGEPKDGEI